LASAWLVGPKFTHFAGEGEQRRAQRKPPEAVKPNRQNVFCGAERIVIEFYAGNAAGRMSMALNSINFFKSATSMHSIGVVDLIVIPLPIHYHVNRFPLFACGMLQVKMPHLNKKHPIFSDRVFFLFRL